MSRIAAPTSWSRRRHQQPRARVARAVLPADGEMRPNRFVWLGAKMALPGFTYSFRENEHGLWTCTRTCTPRRVQLVVETTNEAFLASGSASKTSARPPPMWKGFSQKSWVAARSHEPFVLAAVPVVRCATWQSRECRAGSATPAHSATGDRSGTKLAMEDAIALHGASCAMFTIQSARRGVRERASPGGGAHPALANTSLVFFENVRRSGTWTRCSFNFALMSRSKQITYENLRHARCEAGRRGRSLVDTPRRGSRGRCCEGLRAGRAMSRRSRCAA